MSATEVNPYAPPKANVADTVPDEVAIEPAGRGARFGAAMIDGLLMVLIIYVPALVFVGFDSFLAAGAGGMTDLFFGTFGLVALGGLIVWGAINFVTVKRNSQTVGKLLVGIKVVRSDGSHASLGRIFWLRNIVNAIPSVIPIVGNIYVLVDHLCIFAESRQCLHDKIADTIVIKA